MEKWRLPPRDGLELEAGAPPTTGEGARAPRPASGVGSSMFLLPLFSWFERSAERFGLRQPAAAFGSQPAGVGRGGVWFFAKGYLFLMRRQQAALKKRQQAAAVQGKALCGFLTN